MSKRGLPWLTPAAIFALALWWVGCSRAAASESIGLQGVVSSEAEGRMEGVLVSAKRESSTITITVVSDDKGHYAFPGDRLKAGIYRLSTRAAGYRSADARMEIILGKAAQKDLGLERITDNLELSKQLTASEWILSGIPGGGKHGPGENDERAAGGTTVFCSIGCHGLGERIMDKTRDVSAWEETIQRMQNYIEGARYRPENLLWRVPLRESHRELAKLLSEITGKSKLQEYKFNFLPRPKGLATRVIITQYDLPNPEMQPHDVAVKNGAVWAGDFTGPDINLLDPRTGEVTTYRTPLLREGFPLGNSDIEIDQEGNPWVAFMYQGGIGKLDRKTGKWTTWTVPKKYMNEKTKTGMLGSRAVETRGIVWVKETLFNRDVFKVNVKTGKITAYYPFGRDESASTRHSTYGVTADRKGNGFYMDIDGGNIVKINPDTGKITLYPTPTPDSGPRRGEFDQQDRLWFAEYYANQIGMFDPKTGQFQEWPIPKPAEQPYDVIADKNGEIWGGGWWNDFVFRFNPRTGEWTEYLLPSVNTNIRRVDVDNSTVPVTFWIGENHHGKVTKVEPVGGELLK